MEPKRVAIIGAGAAGMAAAYCLSRHPDLFTVVIYDKQRHPGGMATSIAIDAEKYGAGYVNDGVQGCSPQFANTIRTFKDLGYACTDVQMQISFGKGEDFWTNVFPSSLTTEFEEDIKKFGRVLKIIKLLEFVFAFVSIQTMLWLFRFSKGFGDKMVYPLAALFFGTGNQTPYVSSAILERVFMDPSMRLFEYDNKSLLASIPKMYSFPKLHDVYGAWMNEITRNGKVTFKLRHNVQHVSRSGKSVQVEADNPSPSKEEFDEVIFACDADSALKILGDSATWREKRVLGSVKYLYDITVTHSDLVYMRKYYETEFKPDLAIQARGDEDKEALRFAAMNFKPLYYTMQYPEDRRKIEMSFDLTHYQGQFRGVPPTSPMSPGSSSADAKEPPMSQHVFQTIFLDREGTEALWTRNDINRDKVVAEKWWKQQSHRWQHYAMVVPWMMFINGKNHTHFAGAWTVLNMHEIAMTSGFAAAYRLGAEYPFRGDEECERLFTLNLALSHGVRKRKADRKGLWK